jgi:hypothetical protein
MIKATSVGNTIIAMVNGKMYQKLFATSDERIQVYEKLLNTDEYNVDEVEEIKLIFKGEETTYEKQLKVEFEAEKEKSKALEDILDFMKEVKENGHDIFEVIENSIYVKGIRISTPELLIREIIKAESENNDDRVSALLNFWKLCALNPDPRARFDLFKFLNNHNLTITPSGHFVAYRTVNKHTEGNSELEKFVTQEYLKVKRWKKSPFNYWVCKLEDGSLSCKSNGILNDSIEEIGNLADLYENIGEVSGNVYTDNHTKSFRIKMGEPVTMDRQAVDPDPNQACSYGLHLGNLSFMESNMGFFGKVGLVCLCNPRHVTSVPEYDSGKMRTCEYLPIAIAELDDNDKIKDVEIDVFDFEYAENTKEELEEMKGLSGREFEEYKKHQFIAPEVSFKMLDNIYSSVVMSIEDANNKIKNRVVKV